MDPKRGSAQQRSMNILILPKGNNFKSMPKTVFIARLVILKCLRIISDGLYQKVAVDPISNLILNIFSSGM